MSAYRRDTDEAQPFVRTVESARALRFEGVINRGPSRSGQFMVFKVSFIEPMVAKLVDSLPVGKNWVYEIKLDGYRVLAAKDGNTVRLMSRNHKDLTSDFPHVGKAIATVRPPPSGRSS